MDGWGWQVWTSFFIVGATQDCGFGVSCLFTYFLLDTTMMAFHLWSFQLSILKSVIIVFFARLTDSTSQFDKTVLSKCVTHVGFVEDMSPSGNTFLGRNWEPWSGSEFTMFNLVIRLSEVEQLAFFHFLPCRLSLLEQLAAVPGFAFFRFSPCRLSLVEQLAAVPGFNSFCQPCKPPFFFNVDRETDRCHGNMLTISSRYMPSGMEIFSFYGCWWGSSVHLIQLGTTDSVYRVELTTGGLKPYLDSCMRLWMHHFH